MFVVTPPTPAVRLARRHLYVGITAWTEASLVASHEFYPDDASTPEERLRFYATQFPITEVDSSFYWPLGTRTSELWVDRTPNDFVFDVKAFRLLTHHPTPPSALWADMQRELPKPVRQKPRMYAADVAWDVLDEALRRVIAAVRPLAEAEKLGVLLFQFPRYVYPSRRSHHYLEWLAANTDGVRAAVEFRQARWLDKEHHDETISLLKRLGLTYVSVDEPQGFASSMPPIAEATTSTAVVRFHGRNRAHWEQRNTTPGERFAYDYRDSELREWIPKVRHLSHEADAVHVLFNNCHDGKAVKAARKMAALLETTVRFPN